MTEKSLRELQKQIHADAVANGWYSPDIEPRRPLEMHMLIVSEIAEAMEAVRNGEPNRWVRENGKPEGQAVELADAVIRILDFAELNGWDMTDIIEEKLAYNRTRGHRHGGKLK